MKSGDIFCEFGGLTKKFYICIELVVTLAIIDGVFIWQKYKPRYIRVYGKSEIENKNNNTIKIVDTLYKGQF